MCVQKQFVYSLHTEPVELLWKKINLLLFY